MIRVLVIVASVLQSLAKENCPDKYRRLSQEHSFCKPPNTQCSFVTRGLQDQKAEIAEILKAHNDYRSKIATGSETRAGGLKEASNMLELAWDNELAQIAQKWAEQCNYNHDCAACRSVRGFGVGQNMAYSKYYCQGKCEIRKTEWYDVVGDWYSEVADFHKRFVPALNYTGAVTTHFTQLTWAETYKVGCGYVAYKEDDGGIKQFYVCDYGPRGNMIKNPLYKEGRRCTGCPKNSCCDKTCQGKTYPGLCRLSSSPPIYPKDKNLLYLCDFRAGDPNCEFDSGNGDKWKLAKTSAGNLLSVVVKGGKTATAHFRNPIQSKKDTCMLISLRKGPNVAGEKDDSSVEVEFEQNGQKFPMQVWTYPWADFLKTPVQVGYDGNIKFSIKMSVPVGTPPQYIDIKEIQITNKPCQYGK
ncbi:CRISP/Allergen/PR-1 isoform X3 [Parasteatoda tepidariorum]